MIDADGQHDPADIPRLLAQLERYDMVIAARPGRTSHENLIRWLGNSVLNALGTYLTGMPMREMRALFADELGTDTLHELLGELVREWEGEGVELVAVSTGW